VCVRLFKKKGCGHLKAEGAAMFAVAFFMMFAVVRGHGTELDDDLVGTSRQDYLDHPFEVAEQRRQDGRRRLSTPAPAMQPLRIVPYFVDSMITCSPEQRRFLKNELLPAAIDYWKSALSVVPVVGNIQVERFCPFKWQNATTDCAAVQETVICGGTNSSLHPVVPQEHIRPQYYCEQCSSDGCSQCATAPGGSGVANADYLVYVTSLETPECSGSTLAYASMCQRDQHDRPVVGAANFCPNRLDASPEDWQNQGACVRAAGVDCGRGLQNADCGRGLRRGRSSCARGGGAAAARGGGSHVSLTA
jgi:hypothetical protein